MTFACLRIFTYYWSIKNLKVMCLYSIERTPYIADGDITCYKVVSVRGRKYYAPVVGRRIAKRYIIGRCLYYAHGESEIKELCDIHGHILDFYMIRKGFIHTYGKVEEAFRNCGINKQVYECIIPKGAEYFKDVERSELASKVSRFVRKIKPNQLKNN